MMVNQFVETIRVENGIFQNWDAHLERLAATSLFFFGKDLSLKLKGITVPAGMRQGLVKCRILYAGEIESVEFQHYEKRVIGSLRIVRDDKIDYPHKSTDRNALQRLFEQRGEAGEIIIVKNGCVTDTSFSNLVFENAQGFFTPDTFLLNGTRRQSLLAREVVTECCIREEDIRSFQSIHLVNAMLGLGDMVVNIADVE